MQKILTLEYFTNIGSILLKFIIYLKYIIDKICPIKILKQNQGKIYFYYK